MNGAPCFDFRLANILQSSFDCDAFGSSLDALLINIVRLSHRAAQWSHGCKGRPVQVFNQIAIRFDFPAYVRVTCRVTAIVTGKKLITIPRSSCVS